MVKRKWLAVILTLAMLVSAVVVFPAVAVSKDNAAAPAIATELLKEAGVEGGLGSYVSAVARAMGPRASFRGYEKGDPGYRGAVEDFLKNELGLSTYSSFRSLMNISVTPANEMTRVFIGFKDKPGRAEENMVRAAGGNVRHTYDLIPAIAAELPQQVITALQRNPNVTVIEPDIKAYLIESYQAELDSTWGVKRIGAGAVHNDGQFGTGIKVAVIDTGIDYKHPELSGIYKGGHDFADDNGDPMDRNGHGTHVAGTIAALRNGDGVVGVAPSVHLYALKVFGDDGSANYSDIIAAVEWAVRNGIQVANHSYGSSGNPGTLVRDAFDNSYAKGVLHVAAAGNEGNVPGNRDTVIYPARYNSVIAVAATGTTDTRPSFSSTGPDVELSAPGVNINSTWLNDGYRLANGTSMASPHVAGVAALVWAANSDLTKTGVRQVLIDTADPLGNPNHYGHGLVNAMAAVEAAGTGVTQPVVGSIEGTVKNDQQAVIVGASITVGTTGLSATTDGSGFYEIINVPVGSYDVTAAAAGYENKTKANVSIVDGGITTANFVLAATTGVEEPVSGIEVDVYTNQSSYTWNSWVDITVNVVDDQNSPLADADIRVTITNPAENKIFDSTGTTDASGKAYFRYRIPNRSAIGTYTVDAHCMDEEDSTTFNVSGK